MIYFVFNNEKSIGYNLFKKLANEDIVIVDKVYTLTNVQRKIISKFKIKPRFLLKKRFFTHLYDVRNSVVIFDNEALACISEKRLNPLFIEIY